MQFNNNYNSSLHELHIKGNSVVHTVWALFGYGRSGRNRKGKADATVTTVTAVRMVSISTIHGTIMIIIIII